MRKKSSFIIQICVLLVAMLAAFFIASSLFLAVPVDGTSMEPTVHHEDFVVLYKPAKIKCGDVVVLQSETLNMQLIKRVMGLEGDVIEIKFGEDGYTHVLRNGERITEDYINEPMFITQEGKITVPAGMVYFLGDNRNVSKDSHMGILESVDSILGRVFIRYRIDGLDVSIIKSIP